MNGVIITKSVDRLLRPLGFSRRNKTWNRKSPPFIDVIDIQVSHVTDRVTINAGVFHREIYETCWGTPHPPFIQEPACIVRARIGELIDNYDIWWPLNHPDSVIEIPVNIKKYALPFLERMHSFTNMAEQIHENKKFCQYPPDVLYLAMLRSKLGDHEAAFKTIMDFRKKPMGAWEDKVNSATDLILKQMEHASRIIESQ